MASVRIEPSTPRLEAWTAKLKSMDLNLQFRAHPLF